MRLIVLDEREHHILAHILEVGLAAGTLGSDLTRELLSKLKRAPAFRAPRGLRASPMHPARRGPHRKILATYPGPKQLDTLLLECGHLVGRHHRHGAHGTHCEACGFCKELDEPEPPLDLALVDEKGEAR